MTDLSNLFRSTRSSLPAPSPVLSTLTLSTRSADRSVRDNWNAASIESNIRKGVKKELSKEALRDELHIFRKTQRQAFGYKMLFTLGLVAIFCYIFKLNFTLFLTLTLLIITEISPQLTTLFDPPKIFSFLARMRPIVYSVVFYNLLKWSFGASQSYIWKFILMTVIGTAAYCILTFYNVFFLFTTRQIVQEAFRPKKFIQKISYFYKYLIYRGRMMLAISKHLILIMAAFSILAVLCFQYLGRFDAAIFQPSQMLTALLIFFSIQLLLDFVNFLNFSYTKDIKLSMIARDKIPISLNLLRLQYSEGNRRVQLQCIKSIFLRCCQAEGFLTTETTKSLLYNTYMDIFNQFAGMELQRIHTSITLFLTSAKKNDKTIKQDKKIVEDLFVYFRKAAAFVSSEWEVMKIMSLLQSASFLLSIIDKVQNKSDEEEVKVGGRVLGLSNDIKLRLLECTQIKSLSTFTRGELMSFYLSYSMNH